MIEYRHERKHHRKKEKHTMTTNTIDYAKLADDAADTYTSTRDAYNHATANLAVVDNDRDGFQDIVTPDGHIDMPLFNAWFTQDEKNEIAEQAVAYYLAADAYKEYVQGTMQYFKDAMAASTALALVAEVHRLTHQEDAAGALLRDLRDSEDGLTITIRPYSSNIYSFATTDDVYASDDKRALIDQANDQLGAAMSHYDREATELMLTRSFETEADEWATPHSSHSLNVNDLPTVHDAESNNNMRASESKLCTVDTMLTRHFYVESRERLSEAISNASKNMSSRIKNA